VGIGALLYAMARYDVLYGLFYALVPMVEKSRAPIVALSVFHFAVAALAGIGADLLLRAPAIARESKVQRVLMWAGAATFGMFLLMVYLKPGITSMVLDGDPRLGMIGLIALLAAGLFHIWNRGYVRGTLALAMLGLLLMVEQGNEVGIYWVQKHDEKRAVLLKAFPDTADIGQWLQWQPGPKRVDVNDDDPELKFTFGDWYRLETVHAFTASMLTATSELGWWQDRMVQLYGINFLVGRKATRDVQREVFAGRSGIKIFVNPDVYPRAWTVHEIARAPDEQKTWEMVRDGPADLRTTAIMPGEAPEKLESCAGADQVGLARERTTSVAVQGITGGQRQLVPGLACGGGWKIGEPVEGRWRDSRRSCSRWATSGDDDISTAFGVLGICADVGRAGDCGGVGAEERGIRRLMGITQTYGRTFWGWPSSSPTGSQEEAAGTECIRAGGGCRN
jgi:hypothetical protein